jgi:DNA polymerase (family 10)
MIVPIQNSDVAEIFEKVADLLEIEGENRFRVRAYRDAARTVGGHSRSVAEMVEEDQDLTELPGIGKDLAGKIREIVETGKLSEAEELEKQTDPGASTEKCAIRGFGLNKQFLKQRRTALNVKRLTLDQVMKVRILLRQLLLISRKSIARRESRIP